jgi:hypothetical protein
LVTRVGPARRFIRHPIYSGLLTAMLGTALVNSLLGLIVVAVPVAYFYYCGTAEGRNLVTTSPRVPGILEQDEDARPVPPVGQWTFLQRTA